MLARDLDHRYHPNLYLLFFSQACLNEYLVVAIGFDFSENGPSKVGLQFTTLKTADLGPYMKYFHFSRVRPPEGILTARQEYLAMIFRYAMSGLAGLKTKKEKEEDNRMYLVRSAVYSLSSHLISVLAKKKNQLEMRCAPWLPEKIHCMTRFRRRRMILNYKR